MANKQPFYHRCVMLFTATREIKDDEIAKAVYPALKKLGIEEGSFEIDECDAEPGDPADLM